MSAYVLAFLLALGICLVVTPWVRRLAIQLDVMAQPGGRRIHGRPIPLWGGIAIYAAFCVSSLSIAKLAGSGLNLTPAMVGVLVTGAVILTVGMLDDMVELPAAVQAAVIIGVGILLVAFGVRMQFISNPWAKGGIAGLGTVWSWILTVIWIFVLTKTVDFMDGLDGLAAGIGAIAAGMIGIMAYCLGQGGVALMGAALCGACVGFLRFNFNPAKIFMGTGGSQFIGFALAALSIIGLFKAAAAVAVVLSALVFGVPVGDAVFVVVRRVLRKQPVYEADRTHIHHRLLKRGLTHRQAVLVIYAICVISAGAAVLLVLLR